MISSARCSLQSRSNPLPEVPMVDWTTRRALDMKALDLVPRRYHMEVNVEYGLAAESAVILQHGIVVEASGPDDFPYRRGDVLDLTVVHVVQGDHVTLRKKDGVPAADWRQRVEASYRPRGFDHTLDGQLPRNDIAQPAVAHCRTSLSRTGVRPMLRPSRNIRNPIFHVTHALWLRNGGLTKLE